MRALEIYFVLLFFVAGCMTIGSFQQGSLTCYHTVSTEFFGTAQIVSCEKGADPVYVAAFVGTAPVDSLTHLLQAGTAGGVAAGVLNNLPKSVNTNVHVGP